MSCAGRGRSDPSIRSACGPRDHARVPLALLGGARCAGGITPAADDCDCRAGLPLRPANGARSRLPSARRFLLDGPGRATCCHSPFSLPAFSAAASNGAAIATACRPTIRWPIMVRSNRDADFVPSGALVRRFRWRRRIALSGAARNPLVLVPDLARAAGGTWSRAASSSMRRRIGIKLAASRGQRARLRSRGAAHLGAVIFLRHRHHRGAQSGQTRH